ncbi:ribonuclease H-like domain-containing protein [Rummeliibacillus sp. NPDC094406]|uniref:ribonuclease H-like domain-containing protein n=1 Tax=Rummeliibacillus sp. NPDC094406 TaxID=3364511 RepID=UPI00382C415F
MSYENKILQMKKMLKKVSKTEQEQKEVFKKPVVPAYAKQWEEVGLKRIDNDYGTVFLLEKHYSAEYQHGDFHLGELYDAFQLWESTNHDHPIALTDDVNLMFYDTETTGLKGVGTQIFLNGILEAEQDGFVLKQYVLADPSHEVAFLWESKLWKENKTIVTYNGKSFDWPQLQTRFTLHKKDLPKLPEQKQIDLLHGSKRIWKNDLSRMKLSQVEEEKLGFHRKGDIPGYLAPIIYLDAVKSGDPRTLMKVLEHNEYDLLSLITLYIQATKLLCEGIQEESATTYTNIGKWFGDLSDTAKSGEILEKVTRQYDSNETGYAYFHLAFQQKKQHDFEQAYYSFNQAIPYIEERQRIIAYIELAKIDEHRHQNYDQALFYSKQAYQLVKDSLLWEKDQKQRKLKEIEKRCLRNEKKKLLLGK